MLFDLSAINAEITRSADRLDFLCMNVPQCEACNDNQVQLLDHHAQPAMWRCRKCKHRFTHEPRSLDVAATAFEGDQPKT
jgi:ribosomal protein L37AE/L43A